MTATCPTCQISQEVDRNEDGTADVPARRCASPGCEVWLCFGCCEHLSFTCGGCDKLFCDGHKFVLDEEAFCIGCAADAVELEEPQCECTQTDVDMFDPRGCPFHDSRSPWNVRQRAITTIQEYARAGGAA